MSEWTHIITFDDKQQRKATCITDYKNRKAFFLEKNWCGVVEVLSDYKYIVNITPIENNVSEHNFNNHYQNPQYNTAELQEHFSEQVFNTTKSFKKGIWFSFALKHLIRFGKKDHWTTDLFKAIDYLVKVGTGEFLSRSHPELFAELKEKAGYVEEKK